MYIINREVSVPREENGLNNLELLSMNELRARIERLTDEAARLSDKAVDEGTAQRQAEITEEQLRYIEEIKKRTGKDYFEE